MALIVEERILGKICMSQFIKINFSPTGKIFYRIHSNSFLLDCNKKHKISLFR